MSGDINKKFPWLAVGIVTPEAPRTEVGKPSMFRLLVLDDDYTPTEFVIHVLDKVFGKNLDDARKIMVDVHRKGAGVCGLYSFEVAETKIALAIQLAARERHPLQFALEKE